VYYGTFMERTTSPEAKMDAKAVREYRKSLRAAWPHRHASLRARTVIGVCVSRLRQAEALRS